MIELVHDYWLFFLVGQYPHGPLGGLVATILLSVIGITMAFPIGLLFAVCATSPSQPIRVVARAVANVIRSVPLIMLIFWTYFLVPYLIGRSISGFATMACTLMLFQGVYLGEIIRAGIEALPRGQAEAARATGLSYVQTLTYVVLPQALYNMLPSIVSQFVATIKDTSLGYVISVQELTFAGNQINTAVLVKPFQVFAIVSLMYFTVCFSLSQAARHLEKRITMRRAGRSQVEQSA